MGRTRHTTLRTAAVVTLAALFTGAAATAASGASGSGEVTPPTPIDMPAGQYIVVLEEAPVATYDGGAPGLAPTAPDEGEKLDANSASAKKYSAYLTKKQKAVADAAGVEADYSYTFTLNGFAADLSASEAAKLSGMRGVQGVYPDEIRHPDAVPSTDFLGLSGPYGVWQALGGVANAGKGVVVGVVDTGIAPENPSFAGDPLGTAASTTTPYLDGNTVVFDKADGTQFRSARVNGQDWDNSAYSTKLVGGKYFSAGAAAAGFDFSFDFLSPRDGDGHGSHTTSTAAGNNGVAASVEGVGFGTISGVAPAAKVAMYKACYAGPDPFDNTDDICALSDLLAAINAATADGVDVINYSIGGGAATTVLGPEDFSFFNAAAAGIFVAVSAGNAGPDYSTADHASPWYTTVAASTIPTYEGTVELGDGWQAPGVTVSVPFGETVEGEVVYAGDIVAAGEDPAEAALCFPGTIDPAQASGKIVVCDRGVNARVEKSLVVSDAGGIGMILVNVAQGSLDNDFHSVPTVHIQANYRDDLLDYVQNTAGATATLHSENITGIETPVPQVAGFSSRGPMLADGSDILKPDIAAPGVAILAAGMNALGEDPTWEFLSGTSMASPHIAGLAALYLGKNPNATPAEIKSVMMTTAYDTVNGDGSTNADPFAQGAGHVDPTKFFKPGLLYLNGPADWAAFLQGKGLYDFGIEPIDGSDLNLASIAIGSLSGPQTVTRTVTATAPGYYRAQVSGLDGIDVEVSPTTLRLSAGETATFTVTFAKTDAPVEEWSTGFLTWTGGANAVRSPIAVFPVTADAPAEVSGTGVDGSTDVTITPGLTGDLPLNLSGLAPATLLEDPDNPVPGHSGNEESGAADDGYVYFVVDVPEGTTLSRFSLNSNDDENTDLDLFVYRVVSPDDWRYYETWQSATGSADEQVSLHDPTAGTYLIEVNLYSFTGPFTWDMTYANVAPGGAGSLTATPNPIPATQGQPMQYSLSWTGLEPNTRYLGVAQYGDSAVRTVLTVDSGEAPVTAPVVVKAPKITGTAKAGKKLTATAGTWDPANASVKYQWLRNGKAISGATAKTYTVKSADVGKKLSVRVTATAPGLPTAGVADSSELFVKYNSSTTVTMNRYSGTTSQTYKVTVRVKTSGGPAATGKVTVQIGSKKYTGTLVSGKVTINLGKEPKGTKVVSVTYAGSKTVSGSKGKTAFVVRR